MAHIVLNKEDIVTIGDYEIYAVSWRFTKDANMQYIIDEADKVTYDRIAFPLIWYSKLPKRHEDCLAGETYGDAFYSELTELYGWVKIWKNPIECSDWFGTGTYSSEYCKKYGLVTNGSVPLNSKIPELVGINQNNQRIFDMSKMQYTDTYSLGYPNTTKIIKQQLDDMSSSIMNHVLSPTPNPFTINPITGKTYWYQDNTTIHNNNNSQEGVLQNTKANEYRTNAINTLNENTKVLNYANNNIKINGLNNSTLNGYIKDLENINTKLQNFLDNKGNSGNIPDYLKLGESLFPSSVTSSNELIKEINSILDKAVPVIRT